MSISAPFINRPVATILLTAGIVIAGGLAFFKLPVAPLPNIDIPTITISASLPGASPETVANSVASPLERHLGQIADVTEMTSTSGLGQTRLSLQFGLDRDIDGAARDVQAAINAARADLPSSLRSNPTYRKFNPADAPILILSMTSKTYTRGQLYDVATNVLQQRLSQLSGIGQVSIGGAALPAVRVELNPQALFKYGIGLEDVRAALASANANAPKGAIEQGDDHFQIYTNDQATHAVDYQSLIVAYRNGSAVSLSDVAEVKDSVEDLRNIGYANGVPSVLVIVTAQPGANVIETVDAVKAELPHLEAAMPSDTVLRVAMDRSTTIRASLRDTETTLIIAVLLVTLVVYAFLGDIRATIVPSLAVPVSIIGTFSAMYLLGYSLDILSLMALTIATGFVVDDAIVVVENVQRHIELGMDRYAAALKGSREVGFTVLSISLSLIAVFLPILFLGGLPGRLFREFTMTLTISILISLVISLTTTAMLCALLLKPHGHTETDRPTRRSLFDRLHGGYERSLTWALRHSFLVMLILFATVALNIWLFINIPKGFFPQEDTGRLIGNMRGDQSISFQAMSKKLEQMMAIIQQDPDVGDVVGFTGAGSGGGGGSVNSASVFVTLKPLKERASTADEIIARLRPKLNRVPGGQLFLVAAQDVRAGGRQSAAQYQYTLSADNTEELYAWAPKLVAELQARDNLPDVNSDQQVKALQSNLVIDRDSASRLGVNMSQIDNTLYDAFGQRQVSTIFSAINQYHVVMEIDPRYTQRPSTLEQIYVSTSGASNATATTNLPGGTVSGPTKASANSSGASNLAAIAARNAATNALAASGKSSASSGSAVSTSQEKMVPLKAISHYEPGLAPLSVNHQGSFVTTTISFNLKPGDSLGNAVTEIKAAEDAIHMPSTIHGQMAGTAQVFADLLSNELILIGAAIGVIYIVLGILYESYVHPITILSTLPSAGVGAVLALMMFGAEFSIIALIGVILLIGIVKKNAIMMVDFAIEARRSHGATSYEAIREACLLRFRPIMMTTMAAMLGAVPLAISFGDGAEIRRPLGISIVGGLMISQLLTLYTTPVVYLYLDRLATWVSSLRKRGGQPVVTAPQPD